MNMRSQSEDRTAKAVIRDEAMRLFAAHGADGVTVRQIASAASVSPALVIQHFGSKDGLRDAVDSHVVAFFGALMADITNVDPAEPAQNPSVYSAMAAAFAVNPAMPVYLGRLLVGGGPAAQQLFGHLLVGAREGLDTMVGMGTAVPGDDPATRAAFLLLNDLAVIILHERVREAIGVDPLSTAGMAQWGTEVLAIYAGGLTHGGVNAPEKERN
jgi:TetR/AcrR family transcriptional regulator, regulator of cefoperazone and chloramphenicol sensitivity